MKVERGRTVEAHRTCIRAYLLAYESKSCLGHSKEGGLLVNDVNRSLRPGTSLGKVVVR